MRPNPDRRGDAAFALRIAALNAIGFGGTSAMVPYVDARLATHVLYGARVYPAAYLSSLLTIPVFFATLIALRAGTKRGWKCFGACWPIVTAMGISWWVFGPEIPHSGFTGPTAAYTISALIATWVRYSEPELSFLENVAIPLNARMEALKSVLASWQVIAVATSAGFLALLVPWAVAMLNTNVRTVTSPADLFVLDRFSLLQLSVVGITVLLGPIRELVARVVDLGARFADLRVDAAQP